MFFNKANQIIELLSAHSSSVLYCYAEYMETFDEIVKLQSINLEDAFSGDLANKLTILENEADRKRHEVIFQLLQGGFLVDSRKSTMRLVEGVDHIANVTEDVIQMLVFERMLLDDFLIQPLKMINEITKKQLEFFVGVLAKIVTKYDLNELMNDIRSIEEYESEVDRIEDDLIVALFETEYDLATKLHYKQLIRLITSMSDHIEDLSDEVEIILASRRI